MRSTAAQVMGEIRAKAMLFFMHTNIRPTRIYIGRIDDGILAAHCAPYMNWRTDPTEKKRRTWEGMEMFAVDDDFHIEVGSPDFPPDPKKA